MYYYEFSRQVFGVVHYRLSDQTLSCIHERRSTILHCMPDKQLFSTNVYRVFSIFPHLMMHVGMAEMNNCAPSASNVIVFYAEALGSLGRTKHVISCLRCSQWEAAEAWPF